MCLSLSHMPAHVSLCVLLIFHLACLMPCNHLFLENKHNEISIQTFNTQTALH